MTSTQELTKSRLDTLNPGQLAIAEDLGRFLLSRDKEYVISGPGGTGKTYMLSVVLSDVLPDCERVAQLMGTEMPDYEIHLTATTHTASEVLAAATGRPTSTIHSHIAVTPITNYETGVVTLKPRKNGWKVLSNQLIVVDECSTISSNLLSWIRKSTDNTCKIIFLGDHCQMDPVGEDISPIFSNPNRIGFLTQPMRNASQPALMRLCEQMRWAVEQDEFFPIPSVPGVVDHLSPEQAQAEIERVFATEQEDSRILAYTNARVKDYNGFIRAHRGYPGIFQPGELVVNNGNAEIGKIRLRAEQELTIVKVSSNVQEYQANDAPSSPSFEYYPVTIRTKLGTEFVVPVPVDQDVFQRILQSLKKAKNWFRYYQIKEGFPDLRPRDAATVYKAQGSTYDTVYVDLQDMVKCGERARLARMLYVAVSRARSRVVFFGTLPDILY